MGRRIGAEEEAAVAGGRGLHQRLPVLGALGDRQAIEMRLDATDKNRVAVDHQMMRRDGGGEAGVGGKHNVHRLFRCGVLQNDAQGREAGAQRNEHPLDEHRLAVEDIDRRIGDLAMDEQRHVGRLHRLQNAGHLGDIGDAAVGIGGGAGGIELDRGQIAGGRP